MLTFALLVLILLIVCHMCMCSLAVCAFTDSVRDLLVLLLSISKYKIFIIISV